MRLITTLGRRYVVSLFLASALTAAAQTTVSGQPGVVVSQGEMNFSELAAREAKAPARPPVRVFHPKFHAPKPKTLPVGTPIHFTPAPLVRGPVRAATAPQPPRSPALSASFPALLDDGTIIPPDTQGTVGPNHLMVTLNSQVLVQFRDGTTAKPPVSLTAFWQAAGGVRDTTDPRVVLDPYNSRWIVSTSGNFLTTTAGVLVGVSATSDPTGTWFLYNIAADPAKKNFCDFPILGFNRNWVVINCNMFGNAAPHNYAGGKLFVINKS